jgi:hypothetical protein
MVRLSSREIIFSEGSAIAKKKLEYWNVFKGAKVWDFDLLDSNDFFIMKSL